MYVSDQNCDTNQNIRGSNFGSTKPALICGPYVDFSYETKLVSVQHRFLLNNAFLFLFSGEALKSGSRTSSRSGSRKNRGYSIGLGRSQSGGMSEEDVLLANSRLHLLKFSYKDTTQLKSTKSISRKVGTKFFWRERDLKLFIRKQRYQTDGSESCEMLRSHLSAAVH